MIKRTKPINGDKITIPQPINCTCDTCNKPILRGARYFDLYLDHRINQNDDSFQYCSKDCLVKGIDWLIDPMFLEDDWGRVNYIISVEEFKGKE